MRVGHHLHAPGQVIRAAQLGVPVLAIVVAEHLDLAIARVNARFGTAFDLFEPTPERTRRCFDLIAQAAVGPRTRSGARPPYAPRTMLRRTHTSAGGRRPCTRRSRPRPAGAAGRSSQLM